MAAPLDATTKPLPLPLRHNNLLHPSALAASSEIFNSAREFSTIRDWDTDVDIIILFDACLYVAASALCISKRVQLLLHVLHLLEERRQLIGGELHRRMLLIIADVIGH